MGSLALPKGYERLTYRDLHPQLVEDTKAGRWTILDFWDSLPWLQGPGIWTPWRAFVAAVFGLPMTDEELAIYRKCTGRVNPPTEQVEEAWMICGRRARKSATAAVIASFVGAYWDHDSYTAPDEPARIPVLAKDKDEAGTIKGFMDAIFRIPALSWMVVKADGREERFPPAETVRLATGCVARVTAATIGAGRSKAVPLALLDEIAFFKTGEAANPDKEIVRAIRPAMTTVPHPLLVGLSSPYAKKGVLWEKFKEHYGRGGSPVLVWQADTLTMHPGNPQVAVHVQKETAKDPVSAKAEYWAQFRDDVVMFISEDVVDRVTDVGVVERPPIKGVQYVAFVDPSGGTSDSMTLAIAHWEQERVVLDLLREERAPFKPTPVTERFCRVLARYEIKTVEGDAYAGEWPREGFDRGFCDHEGEACKPNPNGVCALRYSVAYAVSDFSKREIYRDVLPILTNERPSLLDNATLKDQLTGLERRTGTSGDLIDHPDGAHDDVANAAAGAICRAERLKLKPRVVIEPPKTVVEAHIRKLHETIRKRVEETRKERTGTGGGDGWI